MCNQAPWLRKFARKRKEEEREKGLNNSREAKALGRGTGALWVLRRREGQAQPGSPPSPSLAVLATCQLKEAPLCPLVLQPELLGGHPHVHTEATAQAIGAGLGSPPSGAGQCRHLLCGVSHVLSPREALCWFGPGASASVLMQQN